MNVSFGFLESVGTRLRSRLIIPWYRVRARDRAQSHHFTDIQHHMWNVASAWPTNLSGRSLRNRENTKEKEINTKKSLISKHELYNMYFVVRENLNLRDNSIYETNLVYGTIIRQMD